MNAYQFVLVPLLGFSLIANAGTQVSLNADHVLVVDGKKIFPIGFTIPPPPDGKTPDGKNALRELADAGGTFVRTGGGGWDARGMAQQKKWLDAAARNGMYCWPYLAELASLDAADGRREARLREVINRFKNHPGLLVWKGVDEPEWGKHEVGPMLRARAVIRELDPHHPLVIIQAPRGTLETLRRYNDTGDIFGMDVYPISYPPGIHSVGTNKELSMVGDFTRLMQDVGERRLPVWMVLQFAWSGVSNPGKTLRFPTFHEERFMTYQAIINGARGLLYFGGGIPSTLNERDAKLGWNWTFWQRVLRPVLDEIGPRSPLQPALLAPESPLPITVSGAAGMEFCAREVKGELFLLACKREGETAKVTFHGLPEKAGVGEVLFESPRTVKAAQGKFTDWFAPFEVHVYRFKL